MRVTVFVAVAVCAVAGIAPHADAQPLTFEQALERARARAPEVIASLARVEEARARLLGASFRFRENPVVSVDAGPRRGPETTLDYSVGIGQVFETGGQRAARMTAAEAEVAQATASVDETVRLVVRDVAAAYVRALAADERLQLLTAAAGVAEQLLVASERRYQVGDIPAVELNLTRIAATRARADRIRAEADRHDAVRPLRLALGLSAEMPVTLAGSVGRSPAPRPVLLAALEQAPAVRRIDAELQQARADVRFAQGLRRPDLGARMSVSREADDHIVLGGLAITLPIIDRGQAIAAAAEARVRRLTQERAAIARALELEVTAGLDAFAQRRSAADVLRDSALPAADDNESLGQRSLDAGEINLMEFLLIRQDLTAARLAYVDAQMDAALAAIEIDAAAGVLR